MPVKLQSLTVAVPAATEPTWPAEEQLVLTRQLESLNLLLKAFFFCPPRNVILTSSVLTETLDVPPSQFFF